MHHKTKLYGGSSNFGWPDDTYFDRNKGELKNYNISEDNIPDYLKVVIDNPISFKNLYFDRFLKFLLMNLIFYR